MLLELNKIIGIRRVIPNTWGPPQHLPPPISSRGRRRTLTLQLHHGRSVVALLVALALRARLRRTWPVRAASVTCSWSRRGSRSLCRPRNLAWVGGRFSPSRCFRLRRRTDRRHRIRTRSPSRAIAMPRSASAGASSRKATGSVRRGDHPPRAHAPRP